MRTPSWSRPSWLVVVLLAALLVVVLAPAATAISSSRSSAEEAAARASIPTSVDVAAVDRFLGEQIDAASIPGAAVAITHGDQVVHLAGFGHDATGAPVTADTLFRTASLSKSFTALAVMQLVEEHRLRLDDPVVDHLPEFRIADPRGADITVRQLLEQTSGLADSTVDPLARQQPRSLAEAVSDLSAARLVARPGTQWNYHNPNYQVAARLVEVVAGEPFATYLGNHVFTPAGMTRASRSTSTTRLFRAWPTGMSSAGATPSPWPGQAPSTGAMAGSSPAPRTWRSGWSCRPTTAVPSTALRSSATAA